MAKKEQEPIYIVINPEDYEEDCFFNLKLDAVQKAEASVRNSYHGDNFRMSTRYVFKLVSVVTAKDIRPEDIPTKITEVTDKV